MKRTLTMKPEFTWIGNDIFCGSVMLARLELVSRDDKGHGEYALAFAAFEETVREKAWPRWKEWKPGDKMLLWDDVENVRDEVEKLYRAVFDDFYFRFEVK